MASCVCTFENKEDDNKQMFMDSRKIEKIHHLLTGHGLELVSTSRIDLLPENADSILVLSTNRVLTDQIKVFAKENQLVACINPVDLETSDHTQLSRFLVIAADETTQFKMSSTTGIPEKLISAKFSFDWIKAFIEERLFLQRILKLLKHEN
ncbi:hypothetical protein L21SP5_03858 [Salinivirga cyanobacteriivorans]|uniref:Uncharacterized protein n=2 Tax=Salinivirga cyanobacteriivorans TaxID=1307839 RepID=A0A0S2I5K4_9BACT|nr:hypothetical protein L21SP5_03858 [Salinivirga cyanobacteriivorans]